MRVEDAEAIVSTAIKQRKLVSVDYVKHDGTRSTRLLEPFDVGPGKRSITGEPKFWGWCRDHNRVEQRTIRNIVSMHVTDISFDPTEHWGQFFPEKQPLEW
jgi:predicted DNA-binding transcriptional regulator YafY